MEPQSQHTHGAAVAVIAGIVDVLIVDREIQASPGMNSVEGFLNSLAAVVQSAVAQQKSQASVCEVGLMVGANSIRKEDCARTLSASV